MTFDERIQRMSDLLHNCAAEIEGLQSEAESSTEQQLYARVGLRLKVMAHLEEPDTPPEELREHYFEMLLLQTQMTRQTFLRLASEERFEQTGKKRHISPHNLEMLFKPQRGRKGLADDWRSAGKLVLSQKLGPAYDDTLEFIFFPDVK